MFSGRWYVSLRKEFRLLIIIALFWTLLCFVNSTAQPLWQANLDSAIRTYQTTDFGIVLAATEDSLYALDGRTGERVWRRGHSGLNDASITPVPGTDLILLANDEGDKSRVEAVDMLSGAIIWRSEKVKGDVLQLAVDADADLLALVLVKKTRGTYGKEFKRKPTVHMLRLSSGDELWKRDLEDDIEMMPAQFGEDLGEIQFTLDNYRAPLILDGRLYLFYDGATSYDAASGKEKERDKFKVNESGLALTEADPVIDENYLYTTGRGKIRAINRKTFKTDWEAKDLGVTPEIAIVGNTLYVRTGGQFTRTKDGEIQEKGPFGVSAIDRRNGKTVWRFKGADKGLTNFIFADENTILIADKDDLIAIDARDGKRILKTDHKIDKAQFVLLNENRQAVVGGREEIAAYSLERGNQMRAQLAWKNKHKPPSRGVFKIMAGIALRATALYFRYGGLATSALNIAGGVSTARSALSLRWSGLTPRFGSFDLTTIATNSAKNYALNKIAVFGISARDVNLLNRINGMQVYSPPRVRAMAVSGLAPSREQVQESVFDRLDPTRQMEKLSSYFLRRKQLASLNGSHMYFYTDLPKPFDKKGLIGVNVHTGEDARFVLVNEPDTRFTTDENFGLLYSAAGSKMLAFDYVNK